MLFPEMDLGLRRLVVGLVVIVAMLPGLILVPPPAKAEAAVCDAPLVEVGCKGAKDIVNSGSDLITGAPGKLANGIKGVPGKIGKEVGEAIEKGTKGIFDSMATAVGEAAGWLFLKITDIVMTTTSPNVLSKSFLKQYQQIVTLALALTVAVVSFAVMDGVRRGDVGQLMLVLFANIPMAVMGMFVAVLLLQLSLNVVDALSAGVAKGAQADVAKWFKSGAEWMGHSAVKDVAAGAGGTPDKQLESAAKASIPGFFMLFSSLLAFIGALGLWLELLMRDAALYICAVFLPLSLAASVWPRWSSVMRRTLEILLVIVVTKLVLIVGIGLAAAFLGSQKNVESVLAGAAIMLVVCASPYFLWKVIPFGESVGSQGAGRMGATMAHQMVTTGQLMSMSRQMSASRGGQDAGKSGGTTPRPQGGGSGGSGGSSGSPGSGSSSGGGLGAAGKAAGSAGAAAAGGAVGGAAAGAGASGARGGAAQGGAASAPAPGAAPGQASGSGATSQGGSASAGATPRPKPAGGKGDESGGGSIGSDRGGGEAGGSTGGSAVQPPAPRVSRGSDDDSKVDPPPAGAPPRGGGGVEK